MQCLAVTRGVNLWLKFILALPVWIMSLLLIPPHLLMPPLVSSVLGLFPLQLTVLNLVSASSHRQWPPFLTGLGEKKKLLSNFTPSLLLHLFLPPQQPPPTHTHTHTHTHKNTPTGHLQKVMGGRREEKVQGGLLLLLTLRGSQDLPVNELIFHPASLPPPPPVNDWHFPHTEHRPSEEPGEWQSTIHLLVTEDGGVGWEREV